MLKTINWITFKINSISKLEVLFLPFVVRLIIDRKSVNYNFQIKKIVFVDKTPTMLVQHSKTRICFAFREITKKFFWKSGKNLACVDWDYVEWKSKRIFQNYVSVLIKNFPAHYFCKHHSEIFDNKFSFQKYIYKQFCLMANHFGGLFEHKIDRFLNAEFATHSTNQKLHLNGHF